MQEDTVRTLLVDDNAMFLGVMQRLLAADNALELVGCAASGGEAMEAICRLRPSLVLMDLKMPGMNGLEATVAIKARPDPPRVVIVTLEDSAEHRARAMVAGADGFVSKTALPNELPPLVRRLFQRANEIPPGPATT